MCRRDGRLSLYKTGKSPHALRRFYFQISTESMKSSEKQGRRILIPPCRGRESTVQNFELIQKTAVRSSSVCLVKLRREWTAANSLTCYFREAEADLLLLFYFCFMNDRRADSTTKCNGNPGLMRFVSGHDFSRAALAQKSMGGLYRLRKNAVCEARSVRARLQSCSKCNKTMNWL